MRDPNNATTGATSPADVSRIEKGWQVFDSLARPIGNVTDVEGGRLHVDGRPEGMGFFDVAIESVQSAGNGDVHLSVKMEDVTGRTATSDLPTAAPASESSYTTASAGTRREPAATTERRTDYGSTATTEPTPFRTWDEHAFESKKSWWIWAAPLAAGIAGLAAFFWWRRRQARRGPMARFRHTLQGVGDTLSPALGATVDRVEPAWDLAREKGSPWWLAPLAALPLLYFLWPSKDKGVLQATTDRMGARSWLDYVPDRSKLSQQLPTADAWRERMPSLAAMREQLARQRLADYAPEQGPSPWMLAIPAVAAGAAAWWALRGRESRNGHSETTTGRRVRDIMTEDVQVIRPETTLFEAASTMRQLDIGSLPVCDGRRLQGMVTDRDLAVRGVADGRDIHLTPVRDVMTADVIYAFDDDSVDRAARLMRDHQVRRLPIVNRDKDLVGIVSLGDIAVDADNDKLSGKTLEKVSEPGR